MNDALYALYVSREVDEDECLRVSGDPNEFLRMIGKAPMEGDSLPPERTGPGKGQPVAGQRR
jgi:twitching motility protein PilT